MATKTKTKRKSGKTSVSTAGENGAAQEAQQQRRPPQIAHLPAAIRDLVTSLFGTREGGPLQSIAFIRSEVQKALELEPANKTAKQSLDALSQFCDRTLADWEAMLRRLDRLT